MSPAQIGKLYVDLHTAEQALAREHDRWESHLDFSTCIPPISKEKALRQQNIHKCRIQQITERINACKAQIAAL